MERAARALCELDGNTPGATMNGKPLWQDYLPEARAVIDAIREPNETMIAAGGECASGAAYRRMIDALLKQP